MKGSSCQRLLLITLVVAVKVFSLSFTCQEERVISGCGITSLLDGRQGPTTDDVELFAGSKRGIIHHLQYSKDALSSLGEIHDESVDGSKPFPVFSMASTQSGGPSFQLFCGGGDRYIAVWELREERTWICLQRLGPHTGWVKGLLYDHRKDALHSIGCNCIESWQRAIDSDETSIWTHAAKRSIESSLVEGATLSSDLLCLCASHDDSNCFFAGGVDGRIHAWSSHIAVRDPLYSIGAHNGRINVLAYAPSAKLLFSSGHDGSIQCRRVSGNRQLDKLPDANARFLDVNGDPSRVTAFGFLHDSKDTVQFVVGTITGDLVCFRALVSDDSVILTKDTASSRCRLADEPMINAICPLLSPRAPEESCWSLAVGHSLGLSFVSIAR